jgi:hypothetical protein
MRALVLIITLMLAACGAPSDTATPDGGACDGSIPLSCDGVCFWRCTDGRWERSAPCRPCVCVDVPTQNACVGFEP